MNKYTLIRFQVCAIFALSLAFQSNVSAQQQSETNQEAMLNWNNGDSLSGQLQGGDQRHTNWISKHFGSPIQISNRALGSITFPNSTLSVEKENNRGSQYMVRMKNGDRLRGQITLVNDQLVSLSGNDFGTIKLNRKEVESIQNLDSTPLLDIDLADLSQWKSINRTIKRWRKSEIGGLVSSTPNSSIYNERTIPDYARIEFELSSTSKLDFAIGLGVPKDIDALGALPRIVSWDDTVVFTDGEGNLESLVESTQGPLKKLKLTLIWDRKKQRIIVLNKFGKLLCNSPCQASSRKNTQGVFFLNKSNDLTIESLSVSGATVANTRQQIGVQRTDGKILPGTVVSFDGKEWTLEDQGSTQSIATGDFQGASLTLPLGEEDAEEENQTEDTLAAVFYRNGSAVTGTIVSMARNHIQLHVTYSRDPIQCNLNGVSIMQFPATAGNAKSDFTHRVKFSDTTLRGKAVPGTNKDGDAIRWLCVGANNPSKIVAADSIISQRSGLSKRLSLANKGSNKLETDMIHFRNRDLLPCEIIAIDKKGIHFNSFSEKSFVSHAQVAAVELRGAPSRTEISNLDKDWTFSNEKEVAVGRTPEGIEFKGAGRLGFGHRSLMSARHLQFDVSWKPESRFELSLFPLVKNAGQPSQQPVVTCFVSGKSIALDNGVSISNLASRKVRVAVQVVAGELIVSLNGRKVHATAQRDLDGKGCSFLVRSVTEKSAVAFQDFSRVDLPGSIASYDPSKKLRALTIPRLQKQNPPKQILCGRNGDLLRGHLRSCSANTIKFQSNLDDFTFNRKLVGAIVWLHPETLEDSQDQPKKIEGAKGDKESSVAITSDPAEVIPGEEKEASGQRKQVQLVLNDGPRISMELKAWHGQIMEGISSELGMCKISINRIQEFRTGKFALESRNGLYSDWVAVSAKSVQLEDCPVGPAPDGKAPSAHSALIGKTVDDIELNLVDGKKIPLSQLQGKVVVLDFWATWCAPCVKSLPGVNKVAEKLGSDKVVLIAVNQGETVEQINSFMKRRDWKFKAASDPSSSIGSKFGVSNIPQTVVIDPEGKIVAVHVGSSPDLLGKLTEEIQASLEK